MEDLPTPKRPIRLPAILSREEVERLIQCANSPLHRVCILTLYGTGMRREELVRMKLEHIDSARMLIHIVKARAGRTARFNRLRNAGETEITLPAKTALPVATS